MPKPPALPSAANWRNDCVRRQLFARVANGADALPEAELQALFAHRYLLGSSVAPERFTVDGLRAALQQRLRRVAVAAGRISEALAGLETRPANC
jgi:predicted exporter